MTAEVTVMNKIGVALAADSAVTIGQDATKIYTSAEKLFQLSSEAAVGIMIYGNASFVGVPWETTIKAYRKFLGKKTFPLLKDYANDFVNFIKKNRTIFPKSNQDNEILKTVYHYYIFLRERMAEKINTEAENRDGLEEDDIKIILEEVVSNHLSKIKNSDYLIEFSSKDLPEIRKKYSKRINAIKLEAYGKLPFSAKTKRELTTIAIQLIIKDYLGPNKSGVVITGFGDNEYFPALIHYEFGEMVLNRPRYAKEKYTEIDDKNYSSVRAFAQKDMVYSFMQGISHELLQYMSVSTAKLFIGSIDLFVKEIKKGDANLGKKIENIMDSNIPDLIEDLFERWEAKQEEYWGTSFRYCFCIAKR